MTIIIIPLVWKLIFQKDTSRASSSLHVHLVPLYCYYQVNVFFPSTNLTLFESSIIKLSHLVHPSFAFKKPPFQSFQRYSFQFTFLPTSTANSTRVTHPVFRPLASSNCFTIIHLWYPFLRAPRQPWHPPHHLSLSVHSLLYPITGYSFLFSISFLPSFPPVA